MKKILVVFTTGFVPYGGLTTVMMNYFRAINHDGLHFDFACTNEPPQELIDEINSYGSHYFKLPSRSKHVLQYFCKLQKLCKGYDIVHVHGNSSTSLIELFAAKTAGVRKRLVHNHNSVTGHRFINAVLHPFFVYSYTDAIACSKLAGNWLFGVDRFCVLRNAISVERFHPQQQARDEFRNRFGISSNDIVVGHVGKMNQQKNHTFIVDVFKAFHAKVPNSKLLLVGGGVLEGEIRAKVKSLRLDDSVIFAGLRTDIPEMMSVMDMFLFPSLWEGLPLSALEAQAAGLPVFLSDVITEEVAISKQCYSKKLTDSAESWAELIEEKVKGMNRDSLVLENQEELTNAGYNINAEANELYQIYMI